jgi:hypothetical protein
MMYIIFNDIRMWFNLTAYRNLTLHAFIDIISWVLISQLLLAFLFLSGY